MTADRSVEEVEIDYADWPQPQPLQPKTPPEPRYPTEALGAVLGPAAKVIATGVGVPEALVAQCLLAASSLAVQGLCDVTVDGRRRPTSLYCLTWAGSGDRKSSVDRIVIKPIVARERWLLRNHPVRDEDEDSALSSAPPILTCDDPSLDGLMKVLATGYPSVGILSDEAARFVEGYAMSGDKMLSTASGLSSLWDGKPIKRVRGKGPLVSLQGRRVSLHLMMQPGVSNKLSSESVLMGQGFLARCLPAAPRSLAGNRPYRAINVGKRPEVKQYYRKLRELLKSPLPLKRGERMELDPRQLTLTDAAKSRWIKFHDKIERQLGPDGRYSEILPFAAKVAEQALRIAAVIAMVNNSRCKRIERRHIINAIKIVRYYLTEAARVYGFTEPDRQLELARKTLRWARSRSERLLPIQLIYQFGPVRRAPDARSVMKMLVDHGWAKQIPGAKEVYAIRKER